jgi:hypothetical protein
MRKTIVYILILFLFLSKCDYSTKNNEKDKRVHPTEYTWTIDTLELSVVSSRFRPTDILYIDENDIYIFGENSYYNDVYWHYDGEEWRDTTILSKIRDIRAVENISGKIYGAGDTQWYLPEGVDYQGSIVCYNSSKWQQVFYAHVDGQRGTIFFDIWGDSEDNIWVGGWYGLLYHFNGEKWTDYCLSDTIWINNFSGDDSDDLYAIGYYFYNVGINGYFLKWNGESWIIENQFQKSRDEYLFHSFGFLDIYVTDDYIYSCGEGVFRKRRGDEEWQKLYQDSQSKYWDISGSGPDNIYAVGEGGNADFWDGDECFYLDSIYYPEITYKKVWTDGTQVIIIGYSNNTAYVMRGK